MADRGRLLKQILAQYRASLPSGTEIPPDGDIACSEEFRAVWDVDPYTTVTAEDFDAALASIPALLEPWSKAVDNTLLDCLGAPDPAILPLATTWFQCRTCAMRLTYPQARHHWCLMSHTSYSTPDRARWSFYYALGREPWTDNAGPRIWHNPSETVRRVSAELLVKACGRDPAWATATEMDALAATFLCGRCCVGEEGYATKQGRQPMLWTAAVCHR